MDVQHMSLFIQKAIIWTLLFFPVGTLTVLVLKPLWFAFSKRPAVAAAPVIVPAVATPPAPPLVPEVDAVEMTVREIKAKNGAEGSVIVRFRKSKKAVTGLLIIWAGTNKRAKKRKGSDSVYDLGSVPGEMLNEEAVAKFFQAADDKMLELSQPRKKASQSEAVQEGMVTLPVVDMATLRSADSVDTRTVDAPLVTQGYADRPSMVIDDEDEVDPSIRLIKRPHVYRGTILEAGMMERPLGEKIINQYGVKYRTHENVEDVLWGSDLKRALESARVKVGDIAEFLKIGRKFVEKGKAPMNMYKVAKLNTTQFGTA